MVPGIQHCGATEFGQNGAAQAQDSEHNIRAALEQWAEKGTASSKSIASKYPDGTRHPEMPQVEMTRPQCPYPESAKFKGSGDPNREENFVCRVPQAGGAACLVSAYDIHAVGAALRVVFAGCAI